MANTESNYRNKTSPVCPRRFIIDGNMIQDKQLIAGKFNDYITNTGPELATGNPMLLKGQRIICVDIITNETKLFKISSVGCDDIKPTIIRQTYYNILETICHIINTKDMYQGNS